MYARHHASEVEQTARLMLACLLLYSRHNFSDLWYNYVYIPVLLLSFRPSMAGSPLVKWCAASALGGVTSQEL